jgi:hypothetical protein
MWSTTGLEFWSIVFWTPLLEGDEGRRAGNAPGLGVFLDARRDSARLHGRAFRGAAAPLAAPCLLWLVGRFGFGLDVGWVSGGGARREKKKAPRAAALCGRGLNSSGMTHRRNQGSSLRAGRRFPRWNNPHLGVDD